MSNAHKWPGHVALVAVVLSCTVFMYACKKDAAGGGGVSAEAASRDSLRNGSKQFNEEVINQGKMDAADKFLSANFVDHGPPAIPGGLKGFKEMLGRWRTAIPDLHSEVVDVIVEGKKVVMISKMSGTWKGDFMGMKATGKAFKDVLGMDYTIMDDKNQAVEHWGTMDIASFAKQTGMNMPDAPPAEGAAKPAEGGDKHADAKAAEEAPHHDSAGGK